MCKLRLAFCWAALLIGVGICGLPAHAAAPGIDIHGDDFNANCETAAATLQQWYDDHGLWATAGWWNAANCVEALEDVIVANNGRKYVDVLDNTFDLNSEGNFLNAFYDDEGWWALAWIRAYDLTGQKRFLTRAGVIFKDMTGGWNDHCGGGIWWKKDTHYVNAIANELFLLVAIRLHQRTPGDAGAGSDLDWAQREWVWFKQSGMINPENLINDGLDQRCENNGRTTWSYNQGVILGGLVELYKTTGDTNYLQQASAIGDAAIHTLISPDGILMDPCETGKCHGGDVPQFKGIFVRCLAELYDVTGKPEYFKFLLRNARWLWEHDRDEANHLGLRWTGPFDKADAARQSSAMFALSAVAEPSTQRLPFAKGAGSADFSHSVGTAIGTLAWMCNSSNAPRPGVMLFGPRLDSLSRGIHVAHFRFAVERLNAAAEPLVRLIFKPSHGGGILAEKIVAWNSFAAASQSQDFQLAFTNSAEANPLEFRVDWNAVSNAPPLTLSDVTIDGGLNWTAANLAHEVGRLDGHNAWVAGPWHDRVSGFLADGAKTTGSLSGPCSAAFELKVDNFNWDNSMVAAISAVDSDDGKIMASQDLRRNQFPNTLYHTFTLQFEALPGRRYEFRTYWHYSPNAPGLTERSLVVTSRNNLERP